MKNRFYLSFIVLILSTYLLRSQELTATQNFETTVKPGGVLKVEITINKGAITGFMKFSQDLPEGYTASLVDSKGGSFSYADNMAKIVWISPPAEQSFTVSYNITAPASANGSVNLGGKISFVDNNERKTFDLEKKYFVVGNNANIQVASNTTTSNAVKAPVITENKQEVIENPKVEEKKETKAAITSPVTAVTKAPSTASITNSGKTYRVQIGAFNLKPTLEGVPSLSTVVLDNGMTKYFSGNFNTYEEASRHKALMLQKGFIGAFIVSFEDGKIVK